MPFIKALLVVAASSQFVMAFNGDATFFEPGALVARGVVNTATDLIAALAPDQYASGTSCGQEAIVNFQGSSVVVTVVDLCPGCNSGDIIDLSPGAFSMLADEALGRIPVTWNFI